MTHFLHDVRQILEAMKAGRVALTPHHLTAAVVGYYFNSAVRVSMNEHASSDIDIRIVIIGYKSR